MSIDAADAALDAAVANLPDSSEGVDGEVAELSSTPCNEDEARALIHKAKSAANQLEAAVIELLQRRAYVALGYASPREMIVREFSNSITNPRTGKPLTDNYLHRVARVMMLLWQVAEVTGVDMAELRLSEGTLRQVSRDVGGVNDVDLLDVIGERVAELEDPNVDNVNATVESTVREAAGSDVPLKPSTPPSSESEASEASEASDVGELPTLGDATVPQSPDDEDGDAEADDSQSAPPPRPSDTANSSPTGDGAQPPSATSVFDTEIPEGIAEGISEFDVASALEDCRTAGDVRRILRSIAEVVKQLPPIIKISKQVPQVVDAVSDTELEDLEQELGAGGDAITLCKQALEVIAAAIDEVHVRNDEAL